MEEICVLDNDKFESLLKILSILEKSETIVINNSVIKQQFNTATIICNVGSLIGENISIHILNPKKYIKLFKAFVNKKGKKISFFEDEEKYVITNTEMNIYCPKQIDKILFSSAIIDKDTFINVKGIGENIKIDKEMRKTIKQLSADNDYMDLLIHKNQIKAISIPYTAIYKFDNYVNEDIDEEKCDFRLRVFTILEIDGESYNISLGIDNTTDSYWVLSKVETGFATISIFENAIRRNDLDNMLI